MAAAEIRIKVPEQMLVYLQSETAQEEMQRNAMIMYPYIRNGVLSHGRAAQILGMKKWDLIELYNRLGCPYLSDVSDLEEDLRTVEALKEMI